MISQKLFHTHLPIQINILPFRVSLSSFSIFIIWSDFFTNNWNFRTGKCSFWEQNIQLLVSFNQFHIYSDYFTNDKWVNSELKKILQSSQVFSVCFLRATLIRLIILILVRLLPSAINRYILKWNRILFTEHFSLDFASSFS